MRGREREREREKTSTLKESEQGEGPEIRLKSGRQLHPSRSVCAFICEMTHVCMRIRTRAMTRPHSYVCHDTTSFIRVPSLSLDRCDTNHLYIRDRTHSLGFLPGVVVMVCHSNV